MRIREETGSGCQIKGHKDGRIMPSKLWCGTEREELEEKQKDGGNEDSGIGIGGKGDRILPFIKLLI